MSSAVDRCALNAHAEILWKLSLTTQSASDYATERQSLGLPGGR